MPLPQIDSRPEKTIDGILSRWNAANLPLQYSISNTKWPLNSEDMIDVISLIQDDNGYAQIVLSGSYENYVAKESIIIAGTTNYNGVHKIRSVVGNTITIDTPFVSNQVGTFQRYYNNYTTLIRVYAGLDPTHEFEANKTIELVGTIEQRPDSDNNTLVDVKEYVKNKLNFDYDATQSSWPNDLNGWTDFYISVAERYDIVQNGSVVNFTSDFTNDEEDSNIVYVKGVHSALQLGSDVGGNMYDYVAFIENPYYDGSAKFMTLFDRPKIIDYIPLDLSIIIETNIYNSIFNLVIDEYDINGNLLQSNNQSIANQDYGVYRIGIETIFQNETNYIEVYLDDAS